MAQAIASCWPKRECGKQFRRRVLPLFSVRLDQNAATTHDASHTIQSASIIRSGVIRSYREVCSINS